MLRMLRAARAGARGRLRSGQEAVRRGAPGSHAGVHLRAAGLQRALDRDQRGAGPFAVAPPRRQQRTPARESRSLPGPPRSGQVLHGVRDRRLLQLRLHAGAAPSRRRAARSRRRSAARAGASSSGAAPPAAATSCASPICAGSSIPARSRASRAWITSTSTASTSATTPVSKPDRIVELCDMLNALPATVSG